jgi:hypothetical protein
VSASWARPSGSGTRVKQLPSLVADPDALSLAGDVLVAVEDDLRGERRMPRHLDRDVPPVGVHQVEGVLVDERLLLRQVADHPGARAVDLPHGGRSASDQDQEHPRTDRVLSEVVLGDTVLALTPPAVDHRDGVRRGGRPHPPREPAGHPDQVRVVQLRVITVQPPPPDPEPARTVTQRVVGVQDDPVHTVVGAGQQIAIPCTEPIGGHETRVTSPPRFANCPEGPLMLGEAPRSN